MVMIINCNWEWLLNENKAVQHWIKAYFSGMLLLSRFVCFVLIQKLCLFLPCTLFSFVCSFVAPTFVTIICNFCYTYNIPICYNYLSFITLYLIYLIYIICYILYLILLLYLLLWYTLLFSFSAQPDWFFLLFYHYYYYIYLYIIVHTHFLFFFLHAAQNFTKKNSPAFSQAIYIYHLPKTHLLL